LQLGSRYSTRSGFFGPFALDNAALFGEIAPRFKTGKIMDQQPSQPASRRIVWQSVVTVVSAAILISAEVFGAAFAGGWAIAILFDLGDTGAHIVQALLFAIGVFVMITFVRHAQQVEPFTRRA
jgi:hypothetical protein